ncbi:MAG: cupin [Ignavibacteria bacterium GWB2_35_12]|nr:MAG: cupin [Ignavibacteria bacterium GWA2_35_8]OGU39982.1 MAG: cupin [Ignavibacteria bacterium GWB2_35_12]OGU90345.1 MAG: cupin [Ignavibacteria bacterium RIFOXYA2_FULL_35_10]OGV22811.1 MAG: cupin [Ignavibacteria bacterium RIFOXYC2_FULL_35_21]
MLKKNIFDNIQAGSGIEIFEDLLKKENLKLERIISYPNSISENQWYGQAHDEWVILLKGSAALQFENDELVELLPGDYLFIPAHTKHKVQEVNNNEPTIWLALHY